MKRTILLILIVSIIFALPDYDYFHEFIEHPYEITEAMVPEAPDMGYDVLEYDIDITLGIPTDSIYGEVVITAMIKAEGTDSFSFNIGDELDIDSFSINGEATELFRRDSERTVCDLPEDIALGDTLAVSIDYHGNPTAGYYADSSRHGEMVYFTHCEPIDSRHWYPCNDWPWDKAKMQLSCTVPMPYKVLSNGILESVDTLSGDRWTWNWRESHQIATYLISLAVFPYAIIEGEASPVPTTYWVYPEDSAMAAYDWERTGEMIELFESLFTPYPYDKYDMSEIPINGAMEHQTATSMGEVLIDGERGWEWVSAHELAHHWFGDLITCGTWKDLWLNEGFATYCEALWYEHTLGYDAYRGHVKYFQDRYVLHVSEGYEPRSSSYDPDFMWGESTYRKPGAILDMLRLYLGDSLFFGGVNYYINNHAHSTAITEDFIADFEEYTEMELGWFFNQWIYTSGHPEIYYYWSYEEDGEDEYIVEVELQQMQPETLTWLLPSFQIGFRADDSIAIFEYNIENRIEVLTANLGFIPDSILLDPNHRMIIQETDMHGIQESQLAQASSSFRIAPNPINSSSIIYIDGFGKSINMELFDISGRRVIDKVFSNTGRIYWNRLDTQDTKPGLYLIRLSDEEKSVVKKAILMD
ncbi:MAG: M1 family aminopeptidase [Candidatus Zixiibacteriota bacterium]